MFNEWYLCRDKGYISAYAYPACITGIKERMCSCTGARGRFMPEKVKRIWGNPH